MSLQVLGLLLGFLFLRPPSLGVRCRAEFSTPRVPFMSHDHRFEGLPNVMANSCRFVVLGGPWVMARNVDSDIV